MWYVVSLSPNLRRTWNSYGISIKTHHTLLLIPAPPSLTPLPTHQAPPNSSQPHCPHCPRSRQYPNNASNSHSACSSWYSGSHSSNSPPSSAGSAAPDAASTNYLSSYSAPVPQLSKLMGAAGVLLLLCVGFLGMCRGRRLSGLWPRRRGAEERVRRTRRRVVVQVV